MIERLLFNKTMSVLEQGLSAASLRNTVIANNLANVETPGYKRSDVVFEEELRKALSQNNSFTGFMTDEKHIPIGSPSIINVFPQTVVEEGTTMRNDGNNVDIDREMAALAKNEIMYQAITQELNGEFQKLKSAIAGR